MRYETEQALYIKSLAMDVIEELMKDHSNYDPKDLKQVTEMFARCMCDLVNVYTNISEHHEMTLRGTVIKAKIGYNALKKKSTMIKK
ncbi:hypothetical protein V6B33_08305 [Mangrovibacillus sp. Mu-81]|jgi:hypothetical protein|uniref:hypothetical protein n=1 Tax=Mangrovibacillus sp. Mu-81 TaxID=3121478 RepID=UPI002FE4574C